MAARHPKKEIAKKSGEKEEINTKMQKGHLSGKDIMEALLDLKSEATSIGQLSLDELNPEEKDLFPFFNPSNEEMLMNHPSLSISSTNMLSINETGNGTKTPPKKNGELQSSAAESAVSRGDASQRRYFLIHNSWSNKVLDVNEDDDKAGAALIIYRKKDPLSSNQLWYMDKNGYIVSKLNGFYIDTSDGTARLQPRGRANVSQQWKYHEDDRTIRNQADQNNVLHIKWGIRFNCTRVIQHQYRGRRHQRWELSYIDAK